MRSPQHPVARNSEGKREMILDALSFGLLVYPL